MVNTKYGQVAECSFQKHCASLANRIWQLIPLREEKCKTLNNNIDRINRELYGMISVLDNSDERIISTICLLENLKNEDDFKVYRADVFRCCDTIHKLGGDVNV